jgi:hypothetical protein
MHGSMTFSIGAINSRGLTAGLVAANHAHNDRATNPIARAEIRKTVRVIIVGTGRSACAQC